MKVDLPAIEYGGEEGGDEPEVVVEKGSESLFNSKKCYICKEKYTTVHHFYHSMCPECAKFNFEKRTNSADMTGKYALVTGGRTKIGSEIAVSLLRNGTTVYLTSRFPKDTLERLAKIDDYGEWKDRLHVACIDFKVPDSIVEFCEWLGTQIPYLDIIINNACQTVRKKPVAFADIVRHECA